MMTTRVKSALILGSTLLIGMLLGGVLNAWLAERRFERVGYFRSEQGFTRHIEEAIGPTDEAQAAAVHEILQRSAARMRQHMDSSGARGRRILDSTRAELATVLTPEQLERVDRIMRQARPGHGPRGPGPGGRGMRGGPMRQGPGAGPAD
ncbi:MAG TPA: hypothetical protein VNA88_17685 [Candidatus Kapabacteria bacterium]|nr:hypothetical protein [Candidatus Kapabacteria bacterium]